MTSIVTRRESSAGPLDGIADRITGADRAKIALPGTDRAIPAEASLTNALRCARLVGVTRLADVTRLDTIGIPTFQAIRPSATTLTVSQGKGLTDTLASVSALMESTELWHAENVTGEVLVDTIAGLGPALTYDPYSDLPLEVDCLLHDDLPLEWMIATSLPDGRPVPVPYRLVNLDFRTPAGWRPRLFQESSNGLASGNTFVEAALHALYEVIERDAIARAHRAGSLGTSFAPRALPPGPVHDLLDRFEAAKVSVDARWMPSPTGLPVVAVRIVSPDYQIVAGGYGCHLSTEIATTRALTEAAQSRLTLISGGRDDLSLRAFRPVYRMMETPPAGAETAGPPGQLVNSLANRSLLDDLAELSRRCTLAFGNPPLLLDLAHPEIGADVVRVIVPGCALDEGVA
ncbi:YcaO-like family protein [Actinoplanes sp. NPDC049668]|uniref:YcaO-like family protein n=1 Tax=unclassified Actinoplanes TaxID=2626549 RepID=UPI0033B4DC3E